MSACPGCPTVPVVSRSVANLILRRRVLHEHREALILKALQWLTQKHPGLEIYAGVNGRDYTYEEAKAISQETGVVASLPCPFVNGHGPGCILGPIPSRGKAPYGWMPTLMASVWARPLMRELARQGAIADAKIALLDRSEGFLTRNGVKELQVEAGIVSP